MERNVDARVRLFYYTRTIQNRRSGCASSIAVQPRICSQQPFHRFPSPRRCCAEQNSARSALVSCTIENSYVKACCSEVDDLKFATNHVTCRLVPSPRSTLPRVEH